MSTVVLAVQEINRVGMTPVYTGAGASPLLNVTDTFKFNNTGKEILHFKKSGVGNCIVTIKTPGAVDGLAIADRSVTVVENSGDIFVGPFPPAVYNTPGTNMAEGFTLSEVTGLTAAVLRVG